MTDFIVATVAVVGLITLAAGSVLLCDYTIHKMRERNDRKLKRLDQIKPLAQPVFVAPGKPRPDKFPVWVSPRDRRVQAAALILAAEHVKVGRGIRWHRVSVHGRMDKDMASTMRACLSDALTTYFNEREKESP